MQSYILSTSNAWPYHASQWWGHASANLVGSQSRKTLNGLSVVLNQGSPEFEFGHGRGGKEGISERLALGPSHELLELVNGGRTCIVSYEFRFRNTSLGVGSKGIVLLLKSC